MTDPEKTTAEKRDALKAKAEYEKMKISELRRMKIQGDLIPKGDVIQVLEMIRDMLDKKEKIDFNTMIENVRLYSLR